MQHSVEGGEEREPPPTVVRGQWSPPLPLVRGKRKRKRKVWKRKRKNKLEDCGQHSEAEEGALQKER